LRGSFARKRTLGEVTGDEEENRNYEEKREVIEVLPRRMNAVDGVAEDHE
jgi:hypothetical protein